MFGRCPLRQRLDLQRRARATVGTQYDQLNVTGTVDLNFDSGTNAMLALSLADGYIPRPGTTYTIIASTGTLSHTFDGYGDGTTIMAGNYPFRITYQANAVVLDGPAAHRHLDRRGTDDNWSTVGNWQDNVAPNLYDTLVFPASPTESSINNNLAASTEFTSISIDDSSYAFTGNAILLDEGLTANNASGTAAFSMNIALNADQTFTVASGGMLDISGVISGAYALTKAGAGC